MGLQVNITSIKRMRGEKSDIREPTSRAEKRLRMRLVKNCCLLVVCHFDRVIMKRMAVEDGSCWWFPGNICLLDGTERRSLQTVSVKGNSRTC